MFELAYLELKSKTVSDFLENNFGWVTLIESFYSFYRFKIENETSLSKLFGKLESSVIFVYFRDRSYP